MHPTNIFVADYSVSVFRPDRPRVALPFREKRVEASPVSALYAEMRRLRGGNADISIRESKPTVDGARATVYEVRVDGDDFRVFVYEEPRTSGEYNSAARHAMLREDNRPISRAHLDALRLAGRDVVTEAVERATYDVEREAMLSDLHPDAADEIERLSDALTAETDRRRATEDDLRDTMDRLARMENAVEDAIDKREAAEDHAAALQTENSNLTAAVEDLSYHYDRLMGERSKAQEDARMLEKANDALRNEIGNLNVALARMNKRATGAEATNAKLKEIFDLTQRAVERALA